ncbi:MAG: ADP-forming succinate--CoA ligase subunit beta [Sporomusa sp.]
MRLLEYEGKDLFREYGIALQKGIVAATVDQAVAAAKEIGYPVVIKAQVLSGGRGKAGGVKFAKNPEETKNYAANILGMTINNEITRNILITEMGDIEQELYAGITIDSANGLPVLIFSVSGGVDIEQVAKEQPEKIIKHHLLPTRKIRKYQIMDIIAGSGLKLVLVPKVADVIYRLVELFYDKDATTAEINPLVITRDGNCLALDAKVVIDDSAIKRHSQFKPEDEKLSMLEERAKAIGVAYVPLEGNVAVIAGGAGLALATMDLVSHFNGKPGSFLDTGGGISASNMAEALRISLATPNVKGVVINVFGGINNCEIMAKGISEVLDNDKPEAKIVVKMRGHSQDEGWALLEERNVPIIKYGTSEEAVRMVVDSVEGRRQ